MENVPAFMRRKQERKQSKDVNQEPGERIEANDKKESVKEQIIVQHSTPDELDKVFLKRDGKLKENKPEAFPIEPEKKNKVEDNIKQKQFFAETEPPDDDIENVTLVHSFQPVQHEKHRQETAKYQAPVTKEKEQAYFKLSQSDEKQTDSEMHDVTHSVPDYLLNDPDQSANSDDDWVIEQQILLEDTFNHFNIQATVVNVTQGPAVTRFEIQPAMVSRSARLKTLPMI